MLKMILKKNDDAVYRIIDSQAVILTPEDSRLHTLNEVGTFIWELVDGKGTTERIVERVCDRFDVDVDKAEKDVQHFLDDLMRRNLIVSKKK